MTAVAERTGEQFGRALIGASVVPWVGVLAVYALGFRSFDSALLVPASIVLGVGHVGTSVLFWLDPELAPVRAAHRAVFTWQAVALVVAGMLLVGFGNQPAVVAVLLGAQLWQVHHFSRQNLGVTALWLRANGRPGLTAQDRQVIDLASVAAMLGSVALVAPFGSLPFTDAAKLAGLLVLVLAMWRSRPVTRPAVAFWLPLFLTPSVAVAVLAYGAAHAAQYYVVMSRLRTARPSQSGVVVTIVAGVLLVGGPLWLAGRVDPSSAFRWVLGIHVGLVACHYLSDAVVWKMRGAAQRAYLGPRFPSG